MLDVTITQILNQVNETEYVLYTEWRDMSLKIMLLKSSVEPLMGEMFEDDINFYSKEHSKSCDEYLKETRNALSGKDIEIQYFLQDNKFEWRRNKIWILGKIIVRPASNILVISEMLYDLLKWQQNLQEAHSTLEKENESLTEKNKELCSTMEEMSKIKTSMEKELYQKFILILNAKKAKIRELVNLLNNKKSETKTVFDASTDQSADSDIEQKCVKTRSNTGKRIKKLMSYESTDQSENTDTDSERSFHISSKRSKSVASKDFANRMEGIASTSKEMHETIPRNVRPAVLSASSDESEYELELKIPESRTTTKSNMSLLEFEEELEEDLFP